jgi:multidrug efflux pump subunit AcrA (membrane-fusion protein)
MSTTQTTGEHAPRSPSDSSSGRGDGFDRLPKLAADCETVGAFVRGAISVVREHFAGPIASATVSVGAQSLKHEAVAEAATPDRWRAVLEPMLVSAQAETKAAARLYRVRSSSETAAVIACPFPPGTAEMTGAIAVTASAAGEADLPGLLAELRGLAGMIAHLSGALGAPVGAASEAGDAATEAVARSNEYGTLTQLAFSITNSLRARFDCQQVTMGLVRGKTVKLASISGLDSVKHRSPGTLRIRQAMEECLDLGEPVLYQIEDGWKDSENGSLRFRLHRQWHEATGGAAVLSIPLMINNKPIAIVSLRRAAERPFTPGDRDRIGKLLSPFAPAVLVVRRASRGVCRVAVDRAGENLRWLVGPRAIGRKLIYAAALAGAAWFCFGTMDYTVVTKASIVAPGVNYVTTPHEGRLAGSSVREGDEVSAGDVLCSFDTEQDELAKAELEAEASSVRVEIERLMAEGDVRGAAIADARLAVLDARKRVVEARLARAIVRAPRDGVVIQGDLRGRIGQVIPMGEQLFAIAPRDAWRVELQVPERSIEHVASDATATFAWSARPEQPVDAAIERIAPTATASGKNNVFTARAVIVGPPPDWLRYGVEGHAQIDAGEKPVWWVALHRAIDAVRMELWL